MPGSNRKLRIIISHQPEYPGRVSRLLRSQAPGQLCLIGNPQILAEHKTAFFCSERCPGNAILYAYDVARRLRQKGMTVISCFHSLVEKECLRILLRGTQSIIHCPARALNNMRIPKELNSALEDGRLLFLSPFQEKPRRPTVASAIRRNDLIAAIADECIIPYVEQGGEVARIQDQLKQWNVPVETFDEGMP